MSTSRSPSRTPTPSSAPLTAPSLNMLQHSLSEPNINAEKSEKCVEYDHQNVTQRSKRKCLESGTAQESEISIFMSEMKTMFTEFKEQQNKKIEKIYESIEEIKTQNTNIQSTVTFLSQDYDALKTQISQLEMQLESERKNNSIVIKSLEDKIEKLERGTRSACVEFKNIPANTQESKEKLMDIVIKTGSVINVPIQRHEIKDVYRIGSTEKNNRPVIIEFTTNILKEQFIRMYRKFNKDTKNRLSTEHLKISGPPNPLFLSEYLTPKMRRLFFLARDFASSNEYQYCWVTNGKIYLREKQGSPHILIKDELDFPKK
ncbi:uncharacterized protein LOC113500226 [Trichoplusia ni]|uniref:Uncharacterized protein LOC113500226 n=1 Tax=Trichoplusia ni TaxID=7111 RepID=A0A7E5W964_TRINI|nr:uncharacterized protein LOC113500226 [Trichoplusia ni]